MKNQKKKPNKQTVKNMPMHQHQRRPVKRAAFFHRIGNQLGGIGMKQVTTTELRTLPQDGAEANDLLC